MNWCMKYQYQISIVPVKVIGNFFGSIYCAYACVSLTQQLCSLYESIRIYIIGICKQWISGQAVAYKAGRMTVASLAGGMAE